jgi:parvulin-like peptidyl-prolyl isomerase
MSAGRTRPPRRGWRRFGLATGAVALVAGTLWYAHAGTLPWSSPQARPTAAPAAQEPAAEQAPDSDYARRVVAYINGSEPITRQDLGEYLIARYGAAKLPLLLNKRVIDQACRDQGIEVTGAEVNAALAEELRSLKLDLKTFVSTLLPRYKKSLYEWQEDVIRPRLLLTKLCRGRVSHTEEEVRQAFEANFGEKIECRMIIWPREDRDEALSEYARLRDSEEAFAARAKAQKGSALAAAGGKLKPFGRNAMADRNVEAAAFKLRPGEVSTLIDTPQGLLLLKCDKRIAPDTTVSLESVRDRLVKEILERKVQAEIAVVVKAIQDQARPQPYLNKVKPADDPSAPLPPSSEVVGRFNTNTPVTREELGEYLIARYGVDKVELLVNHRILDGACKARNVSVTAREIDAAINDDLKRLNVDLKTFTAKYLEPWGKTLYEWREDAIKPRLLLTRLSAGRVKWTEEDVRKGYEAYHGEKVECRMILYPPDQAKFALQEYASIRDSDAEFERKARAQPSASLAQCGGRTGPIGRHVLGDDNLEREAFRLQPGEVSCLVGTPQGQVVLKCDKRLPPDGVKLEAVRDGLIKEIVEKKTQAEMQVVFKELRDKANPRLMLKDPSKPEDLQAETKRLFAEGGPIKAPRQQAKQTPQGTPERIHGGIQ